MADDHEPPAAVTIGLRALRFAAYTALAVLVAEAVAGERSAMPVRVLSRWWWWWRSCGRRSS
jgi:hypothetical protein